MFHCHKMAGLDSIAHPQLHLWPYIFTKIYFNDSIYYICISSSSMFGLHFDMLHPTLIHECACSIICPFALLMHLPSSVIAFVLSLNILMSYVCNILFSFMTYCKSFPFSVKNIWQSEPLLCILTKNSKVQIKVSKFLRINLLLRQLMEFGVTSMAKDLEYKCLSQILLNCVPRDKWHG